MELLCYFVMIERFCSIHLSSDGSKRLTIREQNRYERYDKEAKAWEQMNWERLGVI